LSPPPGRAGGRRPKGMHQGSPSLLPPLPFPPVLNSSTLTTSSSTTLELV
jgi:hypothetical protein